jgi:hypothetical protein
MPVSNKIGLSRTFETAQFFIHPKIIKQKKIVLKT